MDTQNEVVERKPFLTRFFEEVMRHVNVRYRQFDYEKARSEREKLNE